MENLEININGVTEPTYPFGKVMGAAGFAGGVGYAIVQKTGFWKGWGYAIIGSIALGGIGYAIDYANNTKNNISFKAK